MCKRARRTPGTAEREAPVAEIIASDARRSPHAGGRGGMSVARQTTLPTAFSRAIDRESHAGLGNSLKLDSVFLFLKNVLCVFFQVFGIQPETSPEETMRS